MTKEELVKLEIYYIEQLKKVDAQRDFIMKQLANIRGQYS